MDFINIMYDIWEGLLRYGNFKSVAGDRLFATAVACIGKDVAPLENEFGCAEAVNNVVFNTFRDYAGGDLSTYRMYHSIQYNKKFIRVNTPLKGDIILSPTGYGGRTVKNGHVGIVGNNGVIMSNNSQTGLWDTHFTLDSWNDRYVKKGGYPVYYYRRISI